MGREVFRRTLGVAAVSDAVPWECSMQDTPDVLLTCAAAMHLPKDWKCAWLDEGWRVEEHTEKGRVTFALMRPEASSASDPPLPSVDALPHGLSGALAMPAQVASGSRPNEFAGLLSRSAFLAQLSDVMQRTEHGCCALMAIRIDQPMKIAAQADRSVLFDLEEQICARVKGLLYAGDAMTIWLEMGFGILVQRDDSASVWELATKICAAVAAEPFIVGGSSPLALTASVGLTLAPHGPVTDGSHPWFASAYAAQAIAHRHGGNRVDGLLTREYEPMAADRVLIIREWAIEAKTGGNVLIEYRALLPVKSTLPPLYCVQAKLRDLRAPLRGVYRAEYLRLARDAGAMVMIDRMSLFQALQTLEQEDAQKRATRLMVTIDVATLLGVPWRWLEAELRRRAHVADRLVIELDACHELTAAEATASMTKLRSFGVHICLASTELSDVSEWARLPADFLRIPASAVEGATVAELSALLSAWLVRERRLIFDGVSDVNATMRHGFNLDYIGGDAVAVVGPRLEHDFATTP
ncbi:MAG: EAL domain-containing protein [Dokdonella sp.]